MGLSCTLHALSAEDAACLASGDRERNPSLVDSSELDDAWEAVHYLITGASDIDEDNPRPQDFLLSGVLFEDVSEHVAVHTAEEVADFADFLRETSAADLADRFNAERMNSLNVYGGPWDSSGKAYVSEYLEGFLAFVAAAAENKQGMMVVIC